MDVETAYKFDGDAKVSEVARFLRERYVDSGWATDGAEPTRVGGYRTGKLRLELVEHVDDGGD